MRRALLRLCVRQLINSQTLSPNEKLFPYLFDEFNAYLFDVGKNPPLQKWNNIFASCKSILVCHAKKVFELF